MPDLQLNTTAFAKFDCFTQQNLELIYAALSTLSLIQICSDFFMRL